MADYNETNVNELKLFAENDGDLYRQRIQPIQKNLMRKIAAGKYSHELAVKLWKYAADDAAKRYGKEFGNGDGFKIFSPADRKQVAQKLADEFQAEAQGGEYDALVPKKYKGLGDRDTYPKHGIASDNLINNDTFWEDFIRGYVECALWSSTDERGEPLEDRYDETSIAASSANKMRADCEKFIVENSALLERVRGKANEAGHDFWLTRNGHGAGFWDGDWPEDIGEKLTKSAKKFGESDLYEGSDDMGDLYVTP